MYTTTAIAITSSSAPMRPMPAKCFMCSTTQIVSRGALCATQSVMMRHISLRSDALALEHDGLFAHGHLSLRPRAIRESFAWSRVRGCRVG